MRLHSCPTSLRSCPWNAYVRWVGHLRLRWPFAIWWRMMRSPDFEPFLHAQSCTYVSTSINIWNYIQLCTEISYVSTLCLCIFWAFVRTPMSSSKIVNTYFVFFWSPESYVITEKHLYIHMVVEIETISEVYVNVICLLYMFFLLALISLGELRTSVAEKWGLTLAPHLFAHAPEKHMSGQWITSDSAGPSPFDDGWWGA